MGIREQIMADDVRKEFRAGDLDLLASILRAEGAAEDGAGGLVPGGQKALDMQAGIGWHDVTGDADVAATTQLSVEVSAAEPAVAQLYDFDNPAAHELGEADLFLVRAVADGVITLRYVAAPSGLPAGGYEYQVLQRNGAGAAVWDWVHYVVP